MNKHTNHKNNETKDAEIKESAPVENEAQQLSDEEISMEAESIKDTNDEASLKLEERIRSLTEELNEAKDKLIRSAAEFDNFRKRMVKERSDIRIFTQTDTISAIVPVLDHFELALASAEQTKQLDTLLEGMKMIKSEFEKTLSSLGVEYINGVGAHFDPKIHEAISSESSEEHEKDVIIRQWRTGYKVGDRVIRPASVVISSGKPEAK